MSKRSAYNSRPRSGSVNLCIDKTRVANLATQSAEEAGVVLRPVWRKIINNVSLPVEVNPVTEVVITAVELLPVVTLHIHISIEHEVNHRILDEDIMHVVELFRTGYHIRALLRSVASLIRVHHSMAGIIQTCDKRFYIPVL